VAQEIPIPGTRSQRGIKHCRGLEAEGDSRLLRVALQNLTEMRGKFPLNERRAQIEFGAQGVNGGKGYFVRDNGAGLSSPTHRVSLGRPAAGMRPVSFREPDRACNGARISRGTGGTVWAEGTVNQEHRLFHIGTSKYITPGARWMTK